MAVNFGGGYYDEIGEWVSSAGDVDGDGLDDILVGLLDRFYFSLALQLVRIPQSMSITIQIISLQENTPSALAPVVLVTQWALLVMWMAMDSTISLLAHTRYDNYVSDTGKAYLILGSSLGATQTINLSDADYHFISEGGGTNLGYALEPAGDIDGDDSGDFMIGAPGSSYYIAGSNQGKVYIFLGASLGNTQEIPVTAADYFLSWRSRIGYPWMERLDFNRWRF